MNGNTTIVVDVRSGVEGSRLVLWASVLVLIGATTALLGVYWDEAWHTDLGRDTFWTPPHLLLYGGVGLVGLVAAVVRGTLGNPMPWHSVVSTNWSPEPSLRSG